MPAATHPQQQDDNQILAALPQKDFERLRPQLEPVTLGLKEIIYVPNTPIPYIYFPKGLEATSCECYGIIRAEYERLLLPPSSRQAS